MTSYIGTSMSRVDGRAKVTGSAQYAGEFKVPNLVYASVVTSTIARGRIARIDASRALAVEGVLDVAVGVRSLLVRQLDVEADG